MKREVMSRGGSRTSRGVIVRNENNYSYFWNTTDIAAILKLNLTAKCLSCNIFHRCMNSQQYTVYFQKLNCLVIGQCFQETTATSVPVKNHLAY